MDAERDSEAPVEDHQQLALTDGGVETALVFRDGFELPCFASFPLLDDDAGRAALRAYFAPFLEIAERRGLPLVLDTVTWRANPDWGARLRYDRGRLAQANCDAVAFARELADGRRGVPINGVVGPRGDGAVGRRGDGYVVGERMSAEQAADYHGWQIGVLCDAGVDQITGLTLTYPEE